MKPYQQLLTQVLASAGFSATVTQIDGCSVKHVSTQAIMAGITAASYAAKVALVISCIVKL